MTEPRANLAKVTVNKPTPAQMAAAEQEYLIRSFDGPLGIEPPYSEHYVRRLSTDLLLEHQKSAEWRERTIAAQSGPAPERENEQDVHS